MFKIPTALQFGIKAVALALDSTATPFPPLRFFSLLLRTRLLSEKWAVTILQLPPCLLEAEGHSVNVSVVRTIRREEEN